MREIFLETENVRKFRNAFEQLTKSPGIGLIHGDSGTGMTTCAEKHATETGAVLLRAAREWTPRSMLAALCAAVTGSEPYKIEACKAALTESLDQTPRAILIDEADRLRNLEMIEHLIELHDTTGAPVILMGDHTLPDKITPRQEILDRISQTVQLNPIGIDDAQSFFEQSTDLQIDAPVARLIHKRIGGNLWRISQVVVKLEGMAEALDTDTVTDAIANELICNDRTLTGQFAIAG